MRVQNEEEKAIKEVRRREREGKSRGQSADHVGAVPVIPRVATRQITHLARVNNYSETHIIVLHYAYISHACVSAGRAFKCCLVALQLAIIQHLGVSRVP